MPPEFYNKLFTMHGDGDDLPGDHPDPGGGVRQLHDPPDDRRPDMAFPRLNMVSYWMHAVRLRGVPQLVLVEGGTRRAGRATRPWPTRRGRPRARSTARPGGWSASCSRASPRLMGSINYITTILMLRAPGMKMFRMPMTVWAMFITALLQAFALPVDLGPGDAVARPDGGDQLLQPEQLVGRQRPAGGRRRPAAALAAPVLVLLAPGRLHHDPAGDGDGLGRHLDLLAQAPVRLQADGLRHRRRSPGWGSSSGATTCSSRG